MNKIFQVCGAAVLLSAAGCDDHTSGQQDIDATAQPPIPLVQPAPTIDCTTTSFTPSAELDALPGGVWLGSLMDCADYVQHDGVMAMISEDGRFRIIAEDGHLLTGVLQTTRDLFEGSGIDFAPAGAEYVFGPTTNLFVAGLVAERQTLEGRWGTEWGPWGYFTFDYMQQTYERATSLADLAGVWSSYASYAGNPAEGVWTIENDGRFSGQDNLGCLQSGQFSLVDDRYNIVSVQLTVSACEFAGTYSGLADLEDLADWWESLITVSVDNGSTALRIQLVI